MKLIVEEAMALSGYFEDSLNEASGQNERNYYVEGIFSSPEKKNRNGRVYPRKIWEREVEKYQKEIQEKTTNTLGEWQHPPRSTVDPIKAVIRIVELEMRDDGNVWGKAKVLNDGSEITNKIKALIKEGMKIGISTRGVGKVSATGMVTEYKLITADLVDMPSDYGAMLNGVVEGVEFINGVAQDKEYEIDENGCIGEACELAQKEIDEAKEENKPCPIQAKIDIAMTELYEKITSDISSYLEEKSKEEKEEDFKKEKEKEVQKKKDEEEDEEDEEDENSKSKEKKEKEKKQKIEEAILKFAHSL